MSQCDVTRPKSAQKGPKQRLSGGCAMGAYLAFNATYLVSTATYCCKLSFNVFLTGQDHGDISLAGVWLHKERFLRTSSIVIEVYKVDNHCNLSNNWSIAHVDLEIYLARISVTYNFHSL